MTKISAAAAAQLREEEEVAEVTLPPIHRVTTWVPIIGTAPLIPHRWDEKAKALMLAAQQGHKTRTHQPKDPEADAEACMYRLPDGGAGMPATAFKSALVSGARLFGKALTMTAAKQMLFVVGEGPESLVRTPGREEVVGSTPRNASGVVDLRYRTWLHDWTATLEIVHPRTFISPASIRELVLTAGMGGVGDWRPSSPRSGSGSYGTWILDAG